MDKHKWFSEHLNKWIDLDNLPPKELIAEILAERKCFLKLEEEMKTFNGHHQIKVLTGISYILCALDNIKPVSPEIQDVYHCLSESIESLREKTEMVVTNSTTS